MRLVFEDAFPGPELDERRWLPCYLPQWSSRAAAAARYAFEPGGGLRLRIDADQPPWCPDLDGEVRVSSLQTGVFSGPLGSAIGQHRFSDRARVREEQPARRLFTPRYGRVEVRLRASADPTAMTALWMIGFEDRPERSAEICVCEIFGRDVGADRARVGMGVHPFGDPDISDDFEQVPLPIDARQAHTYAADWSEQRVVFSVDGREVKVVEQSPAYPMQLMLSLYELPDDGARRGPWPKEAVVEDVRAWATAGR